MTTTSRADINSLLTQMRELKTQAQSGRELQARSGVEEAMRANRPGDFGPGAVNGVQSPDFMALFANAIDAVNETQKQSGALQKAYEQGDPGVTLTQVMVASEKSSVSFQALTQVRNKLVEAYQDVMNMPI